MSTHQTSYFHLWGPKQGGREAAQRVPHTVLSDGGRRGLEHRCGHDHGVAWQEGQNAPVQPMTHPGVPDMTGGADDLGHSSGQARDGHSWVRTDQGAGRQRKKEEEKETKGMVKRLD